MERRNKRTSKRFTGRGWSERLVPFFMLLLLLALVATIIVVVLAVIGLTPGS